MHVQAIWLTYLVVAVTASALFIVAGRRSRASMRTAVHQTDPWPYRQQIVPDTQMQANGDVADALYIALKRLGSTLVSQSIRVDVAARSGMLVRMRPTALADLLEDLLAATILGAADSRLLLAAAARGDRVYISLTDNRRDAEPGKRQDRLRELTERVAMRGGGLDVTMQPEGTTVTLRLAAASEPQAEADAPAPGGARHAAVS